MMPRHALILLLFVLLLPGVAGARKQTTPRAQALHTETIEGYGRTQETARQRALERAQDRVRELLDERIGVPSWEPAPHLLESSYLARYNVLEWLGPATEVKGLEREPGYLAKFQLNLTREYLTQIYQDVRLEQVEQRQHLLARILAGLVAVFLVTAGYLRLEDMTRGFATKLLRLVAGAVLLLVGVALWWTW